MQVVVSGWAPITERQTATGNKEVEQSGVKEQGTLAVLTHRRLYMYCSKQRGITHIT